MVGTRSGKRTGRVEQQRSLINTYNSRRNIGNHPGHNHGPGHYKDPDLGHRHRLRDDRAKDVFVPGHYRRKEL